jgi:hypothetical protein
MAGSGLLRRSVRKFLLAEAGKIGKALDITSNVHGAITVECKATVFGLVSLQAWLKVTLALAASPLLDPSALIWLPCSASGDKTLAKFTSPLLKASELGVQHNSTYAMGAQRTLDEEAKARELALAEANLAGSAPAPEVAAPAPEVAAPALGRGRGARQSRISRGQSPQI